MLSYNIPFGYFLCFFLFFALTCDLKGLVVVEVQGEVEEEGGSEEWHSARDVLLLRTEHDLADDAKEHLVGERKPLI